MSELISAYANLYPFVRGVHGDISPFRVVLEHLPVKEHPQGYIRGADVQFKQTMQEQYIPYEFKDTYEN